MTQPTPTREVKTAGTIAVRVRYCECDPMGVAHHASYVPWLEMGRTELLRESGVSYAELERAGVFLVITRLEVRYRRPVRYDDLLTIATRVAGGGRIKIEHAYEVRMGERSGAGTEEIAAMREAGLDVLAVGETTLACVDRQGRVRPLPQWLAPAHGAM